jgi:hypothetical protein
MSLRSKINSALGFVAGLILVFFPKSVRKPTNEDLKQVEFSASAQRLGVRFTERIRDVFRFKWLKRL